MDSISESQTTSFPPAASTRHALFTVVNIQAPLIVNPVLYIETMSVPNGKPAFEDGILAYVTP